MTKLSTSYISCLVENLRVKKNNDKNSNLTCTDTEILKHEDNIMKILDMLLPLIEQEFLIFPEIGFPSPRIEALCHRNKHKICRHALGDHNNNNAL